MSTSIRTDLDPRFSSPSATATTWDAAQQVLESAELSWITTVRADGRPHVTPLVAVWLDGTLHFTTGPGEQKAVNLAANPHVVVTTGCNDWNRGLDVMVEGQAVQVRDETSLHRLADAWRTKWDGRWQFGVRDGGFHHEDGGEVLVFAVTSTKVLAFGKEPFSQTRHSVQGEDR
jgi:nitroimidazol reductase NimA-like FMN-containing flavoprotein (pyridoxamine 5'-phosphate oxidase superfamily)